MVTAARRDLQRKVPQAARQPLKGCRWLLVGNEVDLCEADKDKWQQMVALSPDLQRRQRLKEDFRALLETPYNKEPAAARLSDWIGTVEHSGLAK